MRLGIILLLILWTQSVSGFCSNLPALDPDFSEFLWMDEQIQRDFYNLYL